MRMRSSAAAAFTLLGSAGCALVFHDDLTSEQCNTDTNCDAAAVRIGTPLVCRQHACQAPLCTQSADCPAKSTCVEGLCSAAAEDKNAPITCAQDSDCAEGSRCGYDGYCYEKWGCLAEDLSWPPAAPNFQFVATLRRVEAPTNPSAVGPLVITACASGDPNCSFPTVRSEQVTIGSDVTVTVPFVGSLPAGFIGSIRFLAGAGGSNSDLVPYYRHFTSETPLIGDMAERAPVMLMGSGSFALLAGFAGVTADPRAAILGLQVYDCGGRAAPGMSMAPLGVTDSLFVPLSGVSSPLVGTTETTADGLALLLNLPPDKTLTFVLRDERQQRVITSTLSVTVHGAALNDVTYYPRHGAMLKGASQPAQ